MEIGVMMNTFPKISETFILNHITGLLDRGHDVSILPYYIKNIETTHSSIEEYDLMDRVRYAKTHDFLPIALVGAVWNTAILTANDPMNLSTIVQIVREQGVLDAGRFAYQASPLLGTNLDVLHAHFGPVGRRVAKLGQDGVCDAFITSFHGWGIRQAERHGSHIYDDLFDSADCLLANTRYTRKRLIELGANPDKIRIQYIGIDPTKFQPNDQIQDSGSITILTVARLHEVKGLKYGIQAVERLSQRFPNINIQYRIVGDGPLKSDLQNIIQTNDIDDIVTICGPMDQTAVIEELQNSDIFLLPSLDEGFGKVLLEAQACELPIVASDVGGIQEAVWPDRSALLVSPRDAHAIANQLEYLIRNPSKRTKIGAAGRLNVRRNFDIRNLNDRLEALYTKLV